MVKELKRFAVELLLAVALVWLYLQTASPFWGAP